MRKHFLPIFIMLIATVSCSKFDGDVTVPAFLHLDRIDVVAAASGESERTNGWYTSDIDAVQIVAYFDGDNSETNLGVFQLPCTIPVLRNETARYINVIPIVKQNGIAATRILYPFLKDTLFRDVALVSGDTTHLGQFDPLSQQYFVEVNYHPNSIVHQEFFENFEPLATNIHFTQNAVEWVTNDAEGARTGNGYARIHTAKGSNNTYFEITDSIKVDDPSKYLYLEIDYRSDMEFRIGLRSPIYNGGNDQSYYAITLYPQQEWKKLYINLGRLWGQMNHYHTFHVIFNTLNSDDIDGYTYLDNVKIVTM